MATFQEATSSTTASSPAAATAPHKKKDAWALSAGIGAIAGATSKTVVAPVERIRLLLQMHGQQQAGQAAASSSSKFYSVLNKEGVAGLWRGNGLAVARAMIQKGLLFSTQDHFRLTLGSDMAAGAIAGLTASGLTYPLDLLRTRHAGQVGSKSLLQVAQDAVTKHGAISLWRGASATLLGGVVYEGARFGVFGWLRKPPPPQQQQQQQQRGGDGPPAPAPLSFKLGGVDFGPAVHGVIASVVAGNVIYPNDTIRRRLQTACHSHETYWEATAALLREGGVGRLYRGFFLYNIKSAPSAAVQFFTYHELKRLYTTKHNAER